MAVATSMAIMGGLGLAKGAFDTFSAAKRQKQHQAELDAYQRQNLQESNPYKNIQLFTAGSDMMRDDAARNMATAMNSIGNAGTRAIIGATPKLLAEQNNVNRELQKGIEDQQMKRAYAIAGDETRIRDLQESRENNDLAGLGNAINTARQDKNMGFNTMLNGAMFAASSMKGQIGKDPENPYDKGDNTNSGMNSSSYSRYSPQMPNLSFAPLQTSSSFIDNNKNFSRYSIPQTIGYNF